MEIDKKNENLSRTDLERQFGIMLRGLHEKKSVSYSKEVQAKESRVSKTKKTFWQRNGRIVVATAFGVTALAGVLATANPFSSVPNNSDKTPVKPEIKQPKKIPTLGILQYSTSFLIVAKVDPVIKEKLQQPSKEVKIFDKELSDLLDSLEQSREYYEKDSLAAPQVGVFQRVMIIKALDGKVYEIVNPEITKSEGSQLNIYTCPNSDGISPLSYPTLVEVKAKDRLGNEFTHTFEHKDAQFIKHAIDHMNGELDGG